VKHHKKVKYTPFRMSSTNIAWGAFPFVNMAANFDVISILGHDLRWILKECSNPLDRLQLHGATPVCTKPFDSCLRSATIKLRSRPKIEGSRDIERRMAVYLQAFRKVLNSNMMWSLPGGTALKFCTNWKRMRYLAGPLLAAMLAALAASLPAGAGPALLVEPSSGLVLYAEDADLPWRPASLTKLMTAYLTFEAIRDGRLSPEDNVTCTKAAQSQPPSRLGMPVGGHLKVDFAVKALIIKSANDVAMMLADKISGSQEAFVELMNKTARRLGMTNTHFVNPNGLPVYVAENVEAPDQSITTARDMAILASQLLKEFPQYAPIFAMTEAKIGKRMVTTHNGLLRVYDGADGMKTGFICAAGYNLVASATRDGRQLVAVVLGERSGGARTVRAAGLFEHGFKIYPWKAVLAPTLATWPVATPEGAKAPNMRNIVCAVHHAKARKKKHRRHKLNRRHRAPRAKKPHRKRRPHAGSTPPPPVVKDG
jgi:D-alanyl-D-alanine carboxypeptidase